MKGDFSRQTFDRTKHYNGVRMQQGRRAVQALLVVVVLLLEMLGAQEESFAP